MKTGHRTKRQSWRSIVTKAQAALPPLTNQKHPINFFPYPSWTSAQNLDIHPTLEGVEYKHERQDKILAAALSSIRLVNPSHTIYTDGYLTGGTSNGGSAVIITTGDPATR